MAIGALISIVGCGGGSSNTPANNTPVAQNGTKFVGYYVDEVITGVSYTCSGTNTVTQTGTTGTNGEFDFVATQTCTFSAGGLEVETTGTLENNETLITEDDYDDLGYLLTLDDDSEPTNGINVTPVTNDLATTYNNANGITSTADVNQTNLFDELAQNNYDYNGEPSTVAETTTQVTNAGNAGCVRNLIGGQTWYIVMVDPSDGPSMLEYIIDVPVANTVVTPLTPGSSPNPSDTSTEEVTVVGDQLWIEDDGKDFAKFEGCGSTPTTPATTHIDAYFYSGNNHAAAVLSAPIPVRFYDNLADAQTYHGTL